MDAASGATIFPPKWWQTLPIIGSKKKILQRLINDRTGVVAGDPILSVAGLAKQAASLYDNLDRLGYNEANGNFRAIGWDWRKGIDDATVQMAIATAIDAFGTATIVVHSTGGLVFRAFIESNPAYAAKIDKVIAFAVPWAGTLDALEAIGRGVSEKFLFVIGFSAGEVRQMTSTCQAAFDLCPPDPSSTDLTGASLFFKNGVPAGPLTTVAEWTSDPAMQALASNAHTRFGVRSRTMTGAPPIINICGWGAATVDHCDLANGSLVFHEHHTGDGTVPIVSSSWLNASRTYFVPIGAYERNAIPQLHPRVWDSPPVVELFETLLGNKSPKPFIAAAIDSDDNFPTVTPVRLRIAAQDANGAALPNARASFLGHSYSFDRTIEIPIARSGLPNNANGFSRFEVQIDWTGGSAKTPIAIRVV